jgi:Zn finger protein HypA/HybF involved in hydrogenase expression
VAERAELLITELPMAGVGHDCGADISMSEPVFACPECKSDQVEMTQGRELFVDYIETDEPEAAPAS